MPHDATDLLGIFDDRDDGHFCATLRTDQRIDLIDLRDQPSACALVDFAKSTPTLITPGGASFVYVDDVAKGIVAALEKGTPGEHYILGGENITHKELAHTALDILGKKHIVMSLPRWVVKSLAFLGRNLHIPLPFNPAIVPYAVRFFYMDNTKATWELGVEFRSIRKTLEPTLEWLTQNGFIE